MPISGIKRILVGTDFSKASKTALGQAARLAVTCDATLEVAHVIPSSILEHIALPESDIREDAETRLNEFLTDVSELNRAASNMKCNAHREVMCCNGNDLQTSEL